MADSDSIKQATQDIKDNSVALADNSKELTINDSLVSSFFSNLNKNSPVAVAATAVVNNLTSSFKDLKTNLTNTTQAMGATFQEMLTNQLTITNDNAKSLTLLSTGLTGLTSSFMQAELGGRSFVNQIKNISNVDAAGAIAKQLGLGDNSLIGKTLDQAKVYLLTLAEAADAQTRIRENAIQMASRSGDLSRIYNEAAGGESSTQNINAIIDKRSAMMSMAAQINNMLPDEISKFYTRLGTIPGALEAVVQTSQDGALATDMLSATIKTSLATGREYSDILNNISTAYDKYNLTGEAALSFSTRMSDVSSNLHVDVSKVSSALSSAADRFTMYTTTANGALNLSEGLAKVMNDFGQSLQSTGLSGEASMKIVDKMIGSINGLSTAQKSFLSAQTGGPGGLMGAFQIEKDLQEGNFEKVFEKVKQQMKNQLGGIVSLDDATKSEGAAAQLQRQIQLLQNGPLGSFASSSAEALKIIDALNSNKSFSSIMDKDELLPTYISRGTDLQELTQTDLSGKINTISQLQFQSAREAYSNMNDRRLTVGMGNNALRDENQNLEHNRSVQNMQALQELIRRDLVSVTKTIATNNVEVIKNAIETSLKSQGSIAAFGLKAATINAPINTEPTDQQVRADVARARDNAGTGGRVYHGHSSHGESAILKDGKLNIFLNIDRTCPHCKEKERSETLSLDSN